MKFVNGKYVDDDGIAVPVCINCTQCNSKEGVENYHHKCILQAGKTIAKTPVISEDILGDMAKLPHCNLGLFEERE